MSEYMTDEPRVGGYLRQAWLVIVLALLYGGALAATQTALGPRVAENQRREAYREIPSLVGLEGEAKIEPIEIEAADGTKKQAYEVIGADGELAGWVLRAGGQGFQSRVELLVGVTPDVSSITGLYVLDQKETPNLGSLVAEPPFRDQFRGLPTDQTIVVTTTTPTTKNEIRAVTGATISSTSVAELVNRAIEDMKKPLRRRHRNTKPPNRKDANG